MISHGLMGFKNKKEEGMGIPVSFLFGHCENFFDCDYDCCWSRKCYYVI
jgi:hypothetical protein